MTREELAESMRRATVRVYEREPKEDVLTGSVAGSILSSDHD